MPLCIMKENVVYQLNRNVIIIGDTKIAFDYRIDSIVEISEMLIIRLEHSPNKIFNENVFGISLKEKTIKWQISKRKKIFSLRSSNCHYTAIVVYENELRLINWCDYYAVVDPLTGNILEERPTK